MDRVQNRSPAEAGLLFFARSIERFDEATARPAAPRRNVILDVANLRITDPVAFESELNQIAGVVTVGLFARRGADVVLVGSDAGVRTL